MRIGGTQWWHGPATPPGGLSGAHPAAGPPAIPQHAGWITLCLHTCAAHQHHRAAKGQEEGACAMHRLGHAASSSAGAHQPIQATHEGMAAWRVTQWQFKRPIWHGARLGTWLGGRAAAHAFGSRDDLRCDYSRVQCARPDPPDARRGWTQDEEAKTVVNCVDLVGSVRKCGRNTHNAGRQPVVAGSTPAAQLP